MKDKRNLCHRQVKRIARLCLIFIENVTNNIGQMVINYVYDSTNSISCIDTNDLKIYIDKFYLLLKNYYNMI